MLQDFLIQPLHPGQEQYQAWSAKSYLKISLGFMLLLGVLRCLNLNTIQVAEKGAQSQCIR